MRDNGWMIVAMVIVAIISLILWVKAPCEFYQFSAASDIPGRCIIHTGE